MKKIFKIIFIVIIIIGAAGYFIYDSSKPLDVSVTIVHPKTAQLKFTEQGIVTGIDEFSVYSSVSGTIESLNVSKGDYVEKGDILCSVEGTDYLYEISILEASVSGYRAQISNLSIEEDKYRDSLRLNAKQLEGELTSLKARAESEDISLDEQVRLQQILIDQANQDFLYAYNDFEKINTLYENGSISKNEYESARNNLEVLESVVNSTNQQMQIILSGKSDYYRTMEESLNEQIQSINSNLSKSYTSAMASYYNSLIESANIQIDSLNKKISELNIIAPVSGEITELAIENTNLINAGYLIASIKPGELTKSKKIEVYVSTKDIHEISLGDKVEIVVKRQGEDANIDGTVDSIDKEAVTKLSSLGVEERRVKVTVVFEDHNNLLQPGYDTDVQFTTYSEDNKLAVPKTALFKDSGQDMVFIIRDDEIKKVPVTLGVVLKTETVVESGLSIGDMVITDANTEGLKEGVKVKDENESK